MSMTEEEVQQDLDEMEEDGEVWKDSEGKYHITEKGLLRYGPGDN